MGCEELSYGLARLDGEVERGVAVGVEADTIIFVAGVYEELLVIGFSVCLAVQLEWRAAYGYIKQSEPGGEVEGCVAIVCKFGVL